MKCLFFYVRALLSHEGLREGDYTKNYNVIGRHTSEAQNAEAICLLRSTGLLDSITVKFYCKAFLTFIPYESITQVMQA